MARTLAYITPDLLRWARESIGYELEDAAEKIKVPAEKLEAAETGDLMLTLRQAERAAGLYGRPLATLFLPEPPEEEPQDAQFRRLPGAPEPPWPPEMQGLVRHVRDRQDAAAELLEALDEEPVWPAVVDELGKAAALSADAARQLLGIGFDEQTAWRDPSGYTPLRRWIDAVEELGILVMQDGTLDVETMRGFASMHDEVPAIVVNTKDDARARAFTIIHELGHLYLAARGHPVGAQTEAWCDDFAGEVLMPRGWMQNVLSSIEAPDPLGAIDQLALQFGVTPYAAAVRVAKADLWPREDVNTVIDEIQSRGGGARATGGNYYWTKIGRLGPSFIRLVLTALDGGAVGYATASNLLDGLKVSHFDNLREYVARRTEQP